MIPRRKTRQVAVGNVLIGGDAPVSVQSMTSGFTYEIDKCVAEINKLHKGGADIVRVAVPERKDTEALKEILKQVTVPIVADVHFHFQRALEAVEAGVHEALLMRDGVIMEGAATNFFGVIDGVIRTHPKSNYILPGITREVVLECAGELGMTVREDPMFVDDLGKLSESFLTGTTNDVMPVVSIDGRKVGDGKPGPVAGRLYSALIARWRMGD